MNAAKTPYSMPSTFSGAQENPSLSLAQRKRDTTISFAALCISLVAVVAPSEGTAQAVAIIGAIAAGVIGLLATLDAFHGKAGICRAVVLVGIIYWFWTEAVSLALDEVPFFVFSSVYPYIADRYPSPLVAKGLIAVTLFGFMATFGYWFVPAFRGFVRMFTRRDDRISGMAIDWICLGIALIGYVPTYLSVGGDFGELVEKLLAMRAYQGDAATAIDEGFAVHLSLLGAAAGAIAFARAVEGSRGSRLLQLLVAGVTLTWVFAGGSRFNLAFVLLPAIFVHMSGRGGDARSERIDRRKIAAVFAAATVMFILQGALREQGLIEGRAQIDESSVASVAGKGVFGHEHFSAALLAIDMVSQKDDYYLEPLLPFFVFHWIPRVWWPGKPVPKAWDDYNETITGGSGSFNVTPSVVGQYYMNWGFFGVAYIGLFFGFLAKTFDETLRLLDRKHQLMGISVVGMWIVFLFLSFRYLHPLYVTFPVAGTVIWFALSRTRRPGG